MRWPVSLACVGSHLICRYDDGKVTHNIEATKTGGGGFHSHPDDYVNIRLSRWVRWVVFPQRQYYQQHTSNIAVNLVNLGKVANGRTEYLHDYYLRQHRLPQKAVTCGSDLRALTPTEVLGVFIGLRARHFEDTQISDLAETDYLLARSLFPRNRHLHFVQVMASIQNGIKLFESNELGHPAEIVTWLTEMVAKESWKRTSTSVSSQEDCVKNVPYTYEESGRLE